MQKKKYIKCLIEKVKVNRVIAIVFKVAKLYLDKPYYKSL